MRNFFIISCCLLSLIIFPVRGQAQNISITNKIEDILIKKDSSFVKHVNVTFNKSDELILYPIFYDSELEKILDIKVYVKKGKHFKPLKNQVITEEDVELEYIASKKVKTVVIPAGADAKVSFTVVCSELMYFADLRFFSNNLIDTLKYKITVPDTFKFTYNIIHKDSLKYVRVDSIKTANTTKWNINVIPEKVEPDILTLFGLYRNKRAPLMRTIVVPKSHKGSEKRYMNDWYLQKVQSKRGLNSEVIQKINELTKNESRPNQILEILYDYVKNNFKYVAIEIGMGAFIPTHANEVFSNKEGDCKDLSNFLSEALNFKGINSDIALAATYDHISDCDFPSLSSANHVVCIAYIDGIPLILDPTDPIHSPKTPVQSIQNRSLLIINKNGGDWHKVKGFSSQQNLIEYHIDLEENSDHTSMLGKFQAMYFGISGNFIRREFIRLDEDKVNTLLKKHYKTVLNNQSIEEFKIEPKNRVIDAKGNLSIKGKIINDINTRILFLDFLPRPFETLTRNELLIGTHLGSNLSKKVHSTIKMKNEIRSFKPIEHLFSEEGVSLLFKISNPSESVITVDYEFSCNYVSVNKENIQKINNILTSFKKVINDPIILNKKY
ncbi:transglutaminase-like domain-containing protein [Croceitalea vernalis]|uniref:Transglutaminase domain-containing protein n=1 Tax=Croceitalea vernalis TaxID=3075599 RepID=A0ABU3BFF4_9FLAO|nr:transglutaminase domain-containing protein [Croceitalea sp. P007]MDT0620875.1 transglutaminase domain-containing protein [Croceitalea sp. P007]